MKLSKNISYYHYGILIIGQGVWKDNEREFVNKKIIDLKIENLYKKSFPDNCEICTQVNNLFNELKGSKSSIEYICNLHLENESILKLVNYLQSEILIKKVYIFQGGPVTKKKEKIIIKDRLTNKIVKFDEFIKTIETETFEEEILYEIRKF